MTDSDVSARADLVGSAAWIAFGLAIVGGSLAMDRLEQFGATLATAPGLVPGVLGATIAALGALLALRALRTGGVAGLKQRWQPAPERRNALVRTAVATVLALVYTLGFVGRISFPISTALFVFAFIMVFDLSDTARTPLRRRAAIAAVIAVATAAIVTLVFERIFLVRLP